MGEIPHMHVSDMSASNPLDVLLCYPTDAISVLAAPMHRNAAIIILGVIIQSKQKTPDIIQAFLHVISLDIIVGADFSHSAIVLMLKQARNEINPLLHGWVIFLLLL